MLTVEKNLNLIRRGVGDTQEYINTFEERKLKT